MFGKRKTDIAAATKAAADAVMVDWQSTIIAMQEQRIAELEAILALGDEALGALAYTLTKAEKERKSAAEKPHTCTDFTALVGIGAQIDRYFSEDGQDGATTVFSIVEILRGQGVAVGP